MNNLLVLIVDNDEIILGIVSDILSKKGHKTLQASNIHEAQVLLKNHSISLLITDMEMPGGNGDTLLQYLRVTSKSPIPSILMTGSVNIDEKKSIDLGATAYLKKPFSVAELIEKIDKVFNL